MLTRPSVLPDSRHVGMLGWKHIWGYLSDAAGQVPITGTIRDEMENADFGNVIAVAFDILQDR